MERLNWLIWACCLERPRKLEPKDDGEREQIQGLVDEKLLLKEKGGDFYLAVFDGWFDRFPDSSVDMRRLKADRKLWTEIFEHPIVREVCFDLNSIEFLYRYDAPLVVKDGLNFPIVTALWLAIEATAPKVAEELKVGGVFHKVPQFVKLIPGSVNLDYLPLIHLRLASAREKDLVEFEKLMEKVRATKYARITSETSLTLFNKFFSSLDRFKRFGKLLK